MRWTRLTLVITEAFVALSALVAGAMFVAEPSGRLMGMTEATLARSPFGSYLVPGIVLFTMVGGTQALAAWAEIRRWPRAGWLSVVAGVVLAGWIADGQRRDGSCGRSAVFDAAYSATCEFQRIIPGQRDVLHLPRLPLT